jgi:hypothetical protein
MENNIVTLAGRFKSDLELKDYCNAQFKALEKAAAQLAARDAEIAHLKALLSSTTTIVGPEPQRIVEASPTENLTVRLIVPKEQAICEIEIERLHTLTKDRALTLEETKRLDVLVKNLYLIKKATIDEEGETIPLENVDELLAIAQVEHTNETQ